MSGKEALFVYLENRKIMKRKVLGLIAIIISSPFVFLWGFIFICAVFKVEGFDAQEDIAYSLGLLIPAAIVFILGLKTRRWAQRAKRYNDFFESRPTGEIFISDLASQMNIADSKVMKELDKLIHKDYLKNCILECGAYSKVILMGSDVRRYSYTNDSIYTNANTYGNVRRETVRIECPHCGAPNTIVKGMNAECEYCGSAIKD